MTNGVMSNCGRGSVFYAMKGRHIFYRMKSIDIFETFRTSGLQVTDSYFYQTSTALYLCFKSENSPTTADDR